MLAPKVRYVLSDERQRLGRILTERLDDTTFAELDTLIERDDTLSRLAVLRQDARDFGWRQMVHEREKRAILEPLHHKACDILPALNISQQNLLYYASLANFYTVYDLRNLKPEQTRLYLLCYAWIRYRQFSDNLVDAMFFHMKQLEDESRSMAKQLMADVQEKHRRETSKIGRLLSLYVDDSVPDPTTFGEVRRRAWKIMPREALKNTAQRMSVKPVSKLALQWQAVDGMTALIRRHLRPLYLSLDLTSVVQDSPWAEALSWLRMVFSKKQTLLQRPLAECPPETLPKRLRPYLLEFGEDGEPTGLNAGRYEFWLYRQIRKRFQAGEFHLNNSLRHRHLSDELVPEGEQAAVLAEPTVITIDKSGANTAALAALNADKPEEETITIRQSKYLNNLVEQDHRNIKRRTRSILGFKSFRRAQTIQASIELLNMIRKGQYQHPQSERVLSPAEQFYLLVA